MKSKVVATAIVTATAFLASCSEETGLTSDQTLNDKNLELTESVMAQLQAEGFETARIIDYKNPLAPELDGPRVLLDKDILVEDLDDILGQAAKTFETPTGEQYRTSALVNNNRTYSVIGYTGGGNALTSKMRTGLQWAVNNYNRLNTGLRFSLSFSASTNADMVVYNNNASGGGGSAGFPSNGRPNKFIQINAGTDGFSTNVNEHVITHEMGHSIGFRHTDYFNRSLSCGSGGNEGTAGVGAILIPGTPSGTDTNSIMQACFGSGEDGEFGPFDIVAMEFMY